MEQAQLDKLQLKLKQWRDERHITLEMQKKNIIANLLEEITEYLRASSNIERVDALCDITVFTMNTFKVKEKASKHAFYYSDHYTDIGKILALVTLFNKTETLDYDDECKIAYSIICLCGHLIEDMGYDYYECMQETIKEINARTGEYDDSIGKFVKHNGAYTREEADKFVRNLGFEITSEDKFYWYYSLKDEPQGKLVKWYKANYEICLK